MDRVDNGTSVLERTSLAGTEFTTGPSSVNQPTVGLGSLHLLCQHLGVSTRVEDNERLTVTGREGG